MNKLIKKLNIDETFTKPIKKPKNAYHKTDNYIIHKQDRNFQADLLFLPTTKEGFKYLLVVVDMWSLEFDIEPLKTKQTKEVKKAFQTIFGRKYLNVPWQIRTDGGTEFKGVVAEFLRSLEVHQTFGHPYRHQNLAKVEALNKSLGRLFNGYMNHKEEQTGKPYREWTDVIQIVREDFNKIRKRKDEETTPSPDIDVLAKPKFQAGQLVHRKLDYPQNALGHKQSTPFFRVGDYRWEKHPRKIVRVIPYGRESQPFRYALEDITETSYNEWELMPSKVKKGGTRFVVDRIVKKKTNRDGTFYLIRWKGYTKKHNSWEPREQLMEDVPTLVEEFDAR